MDSLTLYRQAIERVLTEHAGIPYSHGELQSETVFDRQADRYLLMVFGRDRGRRVHGCVAHLDVIDGKVWVRRDGLGEGVVSELVEAGIPRRDIVLAFRAYGDDPASVASANREAAPSDPQGHAAPAPDEGATIAVP